MTDATHDTDDDLMAMPTGWGDIEVSPYFRPRDLLAVRLLGTDLEWGQMALPVPMDEEEAEDWLPGAPSEMKQGGFHVHEIGLVMDPTRGALVVSTVGDAYFADDEPDDESIRERVLQEYARLSEDEHLIRERLREQTGNDFWSDHDPPIGTAVILRGAAADFDPAGTGLNPAVFVDGTDWQAVPERLGEALDVVARHADGSDKNLAPYLLTAIKTLVNHPTGGLFDHLGFLSSMDMVMAQL